jgi:hypothetical protein
MVMEVIGAPGVEITLELQDALAQKKGNPLAMGPLNGEQSSVGSTGRSGNPRLPKKNNDACFSFIIPAISHTHREKEEPSYFYETLEQDSYGLCCGIVARPVVRHPDRSPSA